MLSKLLSRTLFSLILLNTYALNAFAHEKEIIMLTGDPWPPFFIGQSGSDALGGIGPLLIDELFRHANQVDIRFPLLPWKRALHEVKTGSKDGIALLLKNKEREGFMTFTNPVLNLRSLVYARTTDYPQGFSWNSLEDVVSHKVGYVNGYSYGKEFNQYIKSKHKNLTALVDIKGIFKLLSLGRVDLVISNEIVGTAMVEKMGIAADISKSEQTIAQRAYHIGFSKKSGAAKHIDAINQRIDELHQNGRIAEILMHQNTVN